MHLTSDLTSIVKIYTDGACRGNPGPGGWGAVLKYNGIEKDISGAELHTTNNRMELTAAIEALQMLKYPCRVILTTDSIYLKNGITIWINNWKKRNWRGTGGKPIKNQDLWQKLDKIVTLHQISWHWIKGHNGNLYNERADKLATVAIDTLLNQKKKQE